MTRVISIIHDHNTNVKTYKLLNIISSKDRSAVYSYLVFLSDEIA
jgi:hypothetical protein